MSLVNSNTYIEPVAGTALNTARAYVNNSLRSVLSNFKSTSAPTTVNLVASGAGIGEVDGMLYRSATTNALYISDSVHHKSSPVGGNFTRVGIGNRVENGIVALGANAESYEIGELVATVSENGTLAANSRLYLCVSNTKTAGSTVGFIDVGEQQGISVGVNDNVTFTGQSATGPRLIATSNVSIGTSSPEERLHVVGNTYMQSTGFVTFPVGTTSQRPASPRTGSFRFNSTETVFEGYTGSSWLSIGAPVSIIAETTDTTRYPIFASTTTGDFNSANVSSSKLTFNPNTGRLSATTFNSLSDERYKTAIKTLNNSLDKVKAMRGVSYVMDGSSEIGLVAQEVEQIVPEAVSGSDPKTVAYGNLVGLLVEAIKELSDKIDGLEKQLNEKA